LIILYDLEIIIILVKIENNHKNITNQNESVKDLKDKKRMKCVIKRNEGLTTRVCGITDQKLKKDIIRKPLKPECVLITLVNCAIVNF
jgi:hypothetical protein